MVELRKGIVFLVVSLIFAYMIWINFAILNKYESKKILTACMISGLGLICAGTFFDFISSLMRLNFKNLISICFTAGTIVFGLYIVLWGNYMVGIIAKLNKRAHNDEMTGLYNRIGFEKIIEKRLANINEPFYVMVLDLDKTKEINDNFGHLNGDRYIISAAKIIKDEIGKFGFAGRTGGDEFVAFLESINENEIEKIKKSIKMRASNIFYNEKQNTHISIGYSKYQKDGQNYEELLRVADKRMYEDKKKRKDVISNL